VAASLSSFSSDLRNILILVRIDERCDMLRVRRTVD